MLPSKTTFTVKQRIVEQGVLHRSYHEQNTHPGLTNMVTCILSAFGHSSARKFFLTCSKHNVHINISAEEGFQTGIGGKLADGELDIFLARLQGDILSVGD